MHTEEVLLHCLLCSGFWQLHVAVRQTCQMHPSNITKGSLILDVFEMPGNSAVRPNRYANFNKVGVPFVAHIFLLKRCSTIQWAVNKVWQAWVIEDSCDLWTSFISSFMEEIALWKLYSLDLEQPSLFSAGLNVCHSDWWKSGRYPPKLW